MPALNIIKQTKKLTSLKILFGIIIFILIILGIQNPRGQIQDKRMPLPRHKIRIIALMDYYKHQPNQNQGLYITYKPSGMLADIIGSRLHKYGYQIISTTDLSSIMIRLNLTENDFESPDKLKLLADENIDAILLAKLVLDKNNLPKHIDFKLISTKNFELGCGGIWYNKKGMSYSNIRNASWDIADFIKMKLNQKLRINRKRKKNSPKQLKLRK